MNNVKNFCCDENLSQYTDSMLFESNLNIASMNYESKGCKVILDLMTRGEVNVDYKGVTYRSPLEFPEDLKEIIKTKPYWFNDTEDLYIDANNWFEYIYDITINGKTYSDGIMFETDLSKYSVEELKTEMAEICEDIIDDHIN